MKTLIEAVITEKGNNYIDITIFAEEQKNKASIFLRIPKEDIEKELQKFKNLEYLKEKGKI